MSYSYGNVGGSYDCNNYGGGGNSMQFVLIVVLFILLIIVGASFVSNSNYGY
jgi:uncharacterized protein (TIGR01732 family)